MPVHLNDSTNALGKSVPSKENIAPRSPYSTEDKRKCPSRLRHSVVAPLLFSATCTFIARDRRRVSVSFQLYVHVKLILCSFVMLETSRPLRLNGRAVQVIDLYHRVPSFHHHRCRRWAGAACMGGIPMAHRMAHGMVAVPYF